MHTFIYPSKDTYLNNASAYKDKNFGIDEILEIYALNYGNKLVYTTPLWHDPPQNSSSYGNEGWLAYDDNQLYIYSGSAWRSFPISSSVIANSSALAYFTGTISNITTNPKTRLMVSGSATRATGKFSGSYRSVGTIAAAGKFSTGSFNGTIKTGATFSALKVNGRTYTHTPLTSSLVGSGSFRGVVGTLSASSATGTGPACMTNGTFSGSFTASKFNAYISTLTSSNYYFTNVTNFQGYVIGAYSGSFAPPETAYFLLNPELSRTVVQFDITNISSSIARNQLSSSNVKFTLNLIACGQRNLPLNYTLFAYPISQSWNNGDGRWADGGSSMGASWDFRNYSGSGQWVEPMTSSYEQVDYLRTASYSSSAFQNGGGTWYYSVPDSYQNKRHWICSSSFFRPLRGTSLICSQSYTLGQQGDITMDVSRIVRSWLCGCIPNNGIILATSLETTVPPVDQTNGLLQYFSKETNTIYSPYIDVAWDDTKFDRGSLAPVTGSVENLVTLQQLKDVYKAGSLPKVFVFARDKYQLKQFAKAPQQPSMITPKYLPTSSYFMIKDAESEEVLIDFDQYSKLSCDPKQGNYFKFDTTGLPQERYFKIFIKAQYQDGTVDITDTAKVFKIIR